ncbi:5638_t:CDS:2 [Dentiscutata heterogama]|uniref:5638_t:CDS:1 n=1 Tax=Dentiscutata heterogama TaxID=1316150 RepID=A0ACA9LD07_9GLOM|nr:5638_t:CDS:2 [Dentiscutata heterogama]
MYRLSSKNTNEFVSEIKEGDLEEFNDENFQDIQGLSDISDELSDNKGTHLKTDDKYYNILNREIFINKFKKTKNWCSLFCDLDHFQKINKQYSCETGDHVLEELSNLIKNNHISDKDEFDKCGGKFIIFLIDINLDLAHEIAEEIRSSVETYPFIFNEENLPSITLSIGVSGMNSSVNSCKDLLNHAVEACKTAKEYGRNRVVIWENEQISINIDDSTVQFLYESAEKGNKSNTTYFGVPLKNDIEMHNKTETEPDITINNDNSKVWNDKNSDFVSIRAEIIQETAATKRLFSLLIKQKAEIDKVLDSHPVYALGPDFQQGYSVPCIACWVAEPLKIVQIEQLSVLFDNEFEIINYVVEKQCESLKDEIDLNRNERGGDGDENNKGSDIGNPFIQVKSVANVKVDDDFQSFTINIKINANISNEPRLSRNFLEFGIDFSLCEVGQMLNEICKSLPGFVGYYPDSILIEVSPICYDAGAINVIDVAKEYSPRNHDQEIELVASRETSLGGQISFTAPNNMGITANYAGINSHSTRATTSKWRMKMNGCPSKGVKWAYNFNTYDLKENDADREWPNTRPHFGYWYTTDEMKGFKIIIVQILCCRFKNRLFRPKLKIIKCPKIGHKLEVSFNNLTNFNEGFEKLSEKIHREHEDIILNLKGNNLDLISSTNNESVFQQEDYMSLNREFSRETK